MRQCIIAFSLVVSSLAIAEKAAVKVDGIETDQDTSIVIKKGAQALPKECIEYQIIDGKDEINGAPDFDRKKAYADWKTECDKWKQSMKEMNKENQILQLNCNKPKMVREGEQGAYTSDGSYKLKVKVKENKN